MPPASPERNPGVAIERSDAPLWLYGALAGGLAAFIALSIVAIGLIYPSSRQGPSDAPRSQSAAPRLQTDPAADLGADRAAQDRELTSYGWVDRQQGRARIPIDQAMADIASSGIGDWPGGAR